MIAAAGGSGEAEPIAEGRQRYAGFATRTLSVRGEAPAFLLLHGYTDSADTWRALLCHLAARRRTARAVDLPSHGRADSLRHDPAVLAQLVDFAGEAAAALGPGTVVVGNSLGGTVALLLAERPGSLGGAVPIGPGSFDHPLWLRLSLHPGVLGLSGLLPLTCQWPLRSLAGLVAGMPVGYLPTYLRHCAGGEAQRRHRELACRLHDEARSPYDHSRIGCPVMLVWGDRDRVSLPSGSRHLLVAIPRLRHEVLIGAGHCPQHQAPARIAEILCGFAPAGIDPNPKSQS